MIHICKHKWVTSTIRARAVHCSIPEYSQWIRTYWQARFVSVGARPPKLSALSNPDGTSGQDTNVYSFLFVDHTLKSWTKFCEVLKDGFLAARSKQHQAPLEPQSYQMTIHRVTRCLKSRGQWSCAIATSSSRTDKSSAACSRKARIGIAQKLVHCQNCGITSRICTLRGGSIFVYAAISYLGLSKLLILSYMRERDLWNER